jgi:hypothetical protein
MDSGASQTYIVNDTTAATTSVSNWGIVGTAAALDKRKAEPFDGV